MRVCVYLRVCVCMRLYACVHRSDRQAGRHTHTHFHFPLTHTPFCLVTSAYFLVPRHCTLCSCRPIDRKKTCVFCCCSLWSAATLFGTRLRRWCGCRTTQPPCLHACENLQQSGKRPRTLPCGARSNFHACRSIFSVTSSSQKSKCEHNKRSRGREVEREREGRAGEGGERDYSDIPSLLPPPSLSLLLTLHPSHRPPLLSRLPGGRCVAAWVCAAARNIRPRSLAACRWHQRVRGGGAGT